MSIKFWVGPPGSGKTTELLTEFTKRSEADPSGRFVIVVPEQFTMQTQKEITALHPRGGILNIDVLSFDRLARRIFAETGTASREILSETGKRFLIRRIVSQKKDEMTGLGARSLRSGNVEEIKSMISELLLYGISAEDLTRCAETLGDVPLSRKCASLASLSAAFAAELGERYMTAEEMPDVLARVLQSTEALQGTVIALDGFTGFTPVQTDLVRTMMQRAEVHLTATCAADFDFTGAPPAEETALFAMSQKMLHGLFELAKTDGTEVLPPVRLGLAEKKRSGRFAEASDLQFLSDHLFSDTPAQYKDVPPNMALFTAPSVRAEVEEVGRRISKLIREEGLRYRDIAIISGDMQRYGPLFKACFHRMEIPAFLDEKRRLVNNPFIEYLRAALEVAAEDFSYESIGRLLLTGFVPLDAGERELILHYLPARGIRGRKKWAEVWVHPLQDEDPALMEARNAAREKVCALLLPFAEAFALRGGTVRAKTEALYDFLLASQCEQRLHDDAARHEAAGRMALAQEYRQVYPQIMEMLDKLVELLGEETISRRDYRELLEAGLLEARIGIIPPGADEVTIGDMERTRLAAPKVLFFVGLNEGVLPRVDVSGGLLSTTEREVLRREDVVLKPSPHESIGNDRFYTYLALTRASRKLILSYADLNGGESLRPAYLVESIRTLFPALPVERCATELSEKAERPLPLLADLADAYAEVSTRAATAAELELAKWYQVREAYAPQIAMLYEAAAARRPQDRIGKAVAQAVYGRRLVNSPTRLERFAACAFAHYLRFGIRLEEEERFVYSGRDTGNVIHNALDLFMKRLTKEQLQWEDLPDATRDRLAAESVREAALAYNAELFTDNAQNAYELVRMSRILQRSVRLMQEQLAAGDFVPGGAELAFTAADAPAALRFALPDGAEMILTGRIDRFDLCQTAAGDYIKIMDYKTGTTKFDLARVYHGLQMQLVIYLQAAMERMKREGVPIHAAGIFYTPVQDPVLTLKEDAPPAKVRTEQYKQMKASGLMAAEREVLVHLDHVLAEDGGKSDFYAAAITGKGTVDKRSSVTSAENFRLLGTYVQRKALQFGSGMMAGEVSVAPYKLGSSETACTYCHYKNICGFDQKIPGYRYRELETKKELGNIYEKMLADVNGEM